MKNIKVGEKVMAKWPGSALWFPAEVIALGEDGDSYEVKFEDGTEDEVAENHVTRESSFRRSRSRSPARKSPSRRRSRSPARKASPSRKAAASRSPSRKSSRSPARSPGRKAAQTKTKTTPTRTQTRTSTREDKTAQSTTKRTVTRTESHIYSTRSATRSGVQTLEPAINVKSGKVPKTTHYEFGGPIGVFFAMLLLPFIMFYLYFACDNEGKCALAYPTVISLDWRDYYDCTAYEVFIGWALFQAILTLIPVGRELQGQPLRTGVRLKYRLNGFLNATVCIALFVTMIYYKCGVTVLYDKFLPLSACAMIFSTILAVALYILARRAPGYALTPKGNTGNVFYDFFVGHELNPRPFKNFDMKLYVFRTASFGWLLLDLAFLVKGWGKFPDEPPYPLICVVFFQVFFILDNFFFEETFLTSLDLQHEGVGFLMSFGALAFIPFTYSLQARYLVSHKLANMPQYCLIPIILLNMAGYILYRQSNSMKNRFRRYPNARDMAELESIPTSSGKRLLVAGWWGFVRKPNYLGDIMMALAWSLFCGCDSIIPYFYPTFLILLLIMREREDSRACRERYGGAWDRYCKKVPYRFIPYVY